MCQKCGKSDHPEWILLCDKCDNGWHCSCLRPPLLNIPEGDWHCPPCQHVSIHFSVYSCFDCNINIHNKITMYNIGLRRPSLKLFHCK